MIATIDQEWLFHPITLALLTAAMFAVPYLFSRLWHIGKYHTMTRFFASRQSPSKPQQYDEE